MPRGGHNKKPMGWHLSTKGYLQGYVWVNGRRVYYKQHRWVVEQHIGRKLEAWEDVHHVNGNKVDNRIENLQVIAHRRHSIATNCSRTYKSGYQMNLTAEQRDRRSSRAKRQRLSESGRKAIALMQSEIDKLRELNTQLLDMLKVMRDAVAGAMRVLCDHGIVDPFVEEMHRIGIPDGFGKAADDLIAKAEGQ